MAHMCIKAICINQNGHRIFLSAMKAADLEGYTTIDRYRSDMPLLHPEQGYQRAEKAFRYRRIAKYLKRKQLMPTAILMTSREFEIQFDAGRSEITLDSERRLRIIDGQHRVGGFRYGIREKNMHELADFQVPVIIVEGLDKTVEMEQFATINGTQKAVRTDLVNMILAQVQSQDDKAIPQRARWKVIVARIVEKLNDDPDSPWHNLIVMPNENAPRKKDIRYDPALANVKIVRAASFMTSLKPIYRYLEKHHLGAIGSDVEKVVEAVSQILTAFWSAVRELCPAAFDDPANHVIQKTPGLFSLHKICKDLLPIMHSSRRPWNRESFRIMLQGVKALSDADFWSVDLNRETAEAAKYGSMKGFAELASVLWDQVETSRELGSNMLLGE